MSKNIPNFTMIPNYVFDEIIPQLKPAQSTIYLVIIRETTGWNRATTKINQKQLSVKCNITRQTVKVVTEYLQKRNLINVHGNKKTGLSYSFKKEIKPFNYGFITLTQMLKNLTSKDVQMLKNLTSKDVQMLKNLTSKDVQMLKNLTSDVKKFNFPYILNTPLNTYIKKYKKKNFIKSASNRVRKNPPSKMEGELKTRQIFNEFLNSFDFINFEDYVQMISQLQVLNKSVTKKRVTQNLLKLKANKGNEKFTQRQFVLSIEAFCNQDKYKGVWVIDKKQEQKQKQKNATNVVDSLKQQKVEIDISSIDAELAAYEDEEI